MKILINKVLIPRLADKTSAFKVMDSYKFDGYGQDQQALSAPNPDVPLNIAVDIARTADTVQGYAYWVEIPNANLGDNLPSGLSYETYLDDQEPPVEQTRTWADLSEYGANQAATATMRYWRPANNGQFLYNDIELIQEAGFEVFGQAELGVKLNADYEDPLGFEYTVTETIEYIDANWRFAGYFDFVHAWLRMQEIYEAKGIDDNARWAASTTAEKIILVRWNQVGLAKANDLVPGSWSDARTAKELNRAYAEFETNLNNALDKRFKDYFRYLSFSLSNAGRTKFESDWDWTLEREYIYKAFRFYEPNIFDNALVNWNTTVLGTYVDADFVGTIPAINIVNVLGNVLVFKSYVI